MGNYAQILQQYAQQRGMLGASPVSAAGPINQPAQTQFPAQQQPGFWRKLGRGLMDPRTQLWLMSAGQRLANRRSGESRLQHWSNAVTEGYNTLGVAQQLQRMRNLEEEMLRREQTRKEAGTAAEIKLGERAATSTEKRVEQEGKRVDLAVRQEENLKKYREDTIAVEREGIASVERRAQKQLGAEEQRFSQQMELERDALELKKKGQASDEEVNRITAETRKAEADYAKRRLEVEAMRYEAVLKQTGDENLMGALKLAVDQANNELEAMLGSLQDMESIPASPEEAKAYVDERISELLEKNFGLARQGQNSGGREHTLTAEDAARLNARGMTNPETKRPYQAGDIVVME